MNQKLKKQFLLYFSFIILLSNISANEIWEKEIPPSLYLKKFALKQDHRKINPKYIGYGLFIAGITIATGKHNLNNDISKTSIEELIGGILFSILGLTYLFSDHTSEAMKEYEKIKNISIKKDKEKAAYDSLLKLAEKSKAKKPNKENKIRKNKFFKDLIILKLTDKINKKNPDLFKTPEEKVLNDYLKQIPINQALKVEKRKNIIYTNMHFTNM